MSWSMAEESLVSCLSLPLQLHQFYMQRYSGLSFSDARWGDQNTDGGYYRDDQMVYLGVERLAWWEAAKEDDQDTNDKCRDKLYVVTRLMSWQDLCRDNAHT